MTGKETEKENSRITFRSILLGVIMAAWFASLTVRVEWRHGLYTNTQIPILPYLLLLVLVLGLNPLLRRIRLLRPFSRMELMVVFMMGMISAGISTMGLASHLVPVMSGMYTEHNNELTQWDIYVEPYLNQNWFVGGQEGLQEAAVRLRDADAEWQNARNTYTAARTLAISREQLASARRAAQEVGSGADTPAALALQRTAERRVRSGEVAVQKAERWWAQLAGNHTVEEVLRTFPDQVNRLAEQKKQRQEELDAIEEPAFEIIQEFRRGFLNDPRRALPGFMKKRDVAAPLYWARLKRFHHGLKSRHEVERAIALLEKPVDAPAEPGEAAAQSVDAAIAHLVPVANTNAIARQLREITIDLADHETRMQTLESQSIVLHRYMRYAPAEEVESVEALVKDLDKQVNKQRTRGESLESDKKVLMARLKEMGEVRSIQAALGELAAHIRQADPGEYPAIGKELQHLADNYNVIDASWRRFLLGEIPWHYWARPLFNWVLLILTTYTLLMTFNVLIFKQWAHHERLIYPLAELPEILVGARDEDHRGIPKVFRQGLFWIGLGVSLGALLWQQQFGGLEYFSVPMEWYWGPYIEGSILDGLRPWMRTRIFFTLIGLTFLVPARISYSLWVFHIVHLLQLLILVWLGFGVNEASFPNDWTMVVNFTTAQGGGALLVFSIVMLWKCRAAIFCGVRPSAVAHMERHERIELIWASWTFLASSLIFVAILHLGLGASLFYASLYYLFILVITIGLVRAVAEAGLLSFKCWFGPFHFIRSVFGMNHAWSAPALFSPLFVFHSVLFMAYKVFIAPSMANALKIRDGLRMSRFGFHAVIALGILAGLVVGVGTHIVMAYDWGADNMHQWFYRGVPGTIFETVKTMTKTNPVDNTAGQWWILAGAVMMALLLFFRGRASWLPHPLGLVMFVNPWMNAYWFSIMLGWMFKVLVSKYGNKDTYARLRYLFIGLIVGELLMCATGRAIDSALLWDR